MYFLHHPPSVFHSQKKGPKVEGVNPDNIKKILILHGRGGSSASREKIGKGLADAGHDVWIPDLPSHGQTPLPHPYTIAHYTHDIVDLIEKEINNSQCIIYNDKKETKSPNHQIAKVLIIAHSNGGRIALHLAATHPTLISQLILVNSAGVDLSYDPSRWRQIKRLIFPFLGSLLKKITPRHIRSLLLRAIGSHDHLATDHDVNIKKTFHTMLHTFVEDNMHDIDTDNIPTTLIRGGHDSYTPLRQGKRMHRLIHGSKLIIHPKEKHGIHLHNPSLLLSDIKKVIKSEDKK